MKYSEVNLPRYDFVLHMERPNREPQSRSIWLPILFFGMLGTLIFLQLFIVYKGLKSPAAMEQATIARQLAGGQGFTTKVIRPYAWYKFSIHDREFSLQAQPDISQPPLPSLVMAPIFKVFQNYWEFKEGSGTYFMDRVVSIMSVFFFIGALMFVWLSLFRVFDGRVAAWSMVCVVVSNMFWNLATQGIAQMMTLFFFSMAVFFVLMGIQREAQKGYKWYYFFAGGALALMVLCNYYGLIIAIGLCVALAIFSRHKIVAVFTFVPSLLAIGGMSYLYYRTSGEAFGTHMATLKSALTVFSEVQIFRRYEEVSNTVDMMFLLRKIGMAVSDYISLMYSYMGGIIPAVLFFVACLHPFKNPVTSRLRWVLLASFMFVLLGMGFLELRDTVEDDRQIFFVFAPFFTGFGVAFLYVLWSRWGNQGNTWFGEHGLILVVFAITFMPMLSKLPIEIQFGLTVKGRLSHFPDYVPDRIQRLTTMVQPDQVLFADLPWATAWYADRSSIWLPIKQQHFYDLKKLTELKGTSVAGIYFSANASKLDRLSDLFQIEYHNTEWGALITRGFAGAYGVDTMEHVDFPFKVSVPLLGKQLEGGDSYMFESVFLTDKMQQN